MNGFFNDEAYFFVTLRSPMSSPSFPFTSFGKYPLYKFLFNLFHFFGANFILLPMEELKKSLPTLEIFWILLLLMPCFVI